MLRVSGGEASLLRLTLVTLSTDVGAGEAAGDQGGLVK